MIAEMLPLLGVVALVTIARNIYEFYALDKAERRAHVREVVREPLRRHP
jgi:hypothetical protein